MNTERTIGIFDYRRSNGAFRRLHWRHQKSGLGGQTWRMPTILRFRNFRVVIFNDDHAPAHVHALQWPDFIKIGLNCPDGVPWVISNSGVKTSEERAILRFVEDNQRSLCRAWEEIHGNQG